MPDTLAVYALLKDFTCPSTITANAVKLWRNAAVPPERKSLSFRVRFSGALNVAATSSLALLEKYPQSAKTTIFPGCLMEVVLIPL